MRTCRGGPPTGAINYGDLFLRYSEIDEHAQAAIDRSEPPRPTSAMPSAVHDRPPRNLDVNRASRGRRSIDQEFQVSRGD
jgi:hypothetical protein